MSCRFVIYDLETTGLSPENDEFIQIAAIRFVAGGPVETDAFSSFARPRGPIPPFIRSLTGITDHHVASAPRPEQVLRDFTEWVGDATLIAHNGHRFDSRFLAATCLRHQLPTREVASIDSIQLSKLVFGNATGTRHSLDLVLQRLGLLDPRLRRHDARADVELLARAVSRMCAHLNLDPGLAGVPRHTTLLPETHARP